MVAAFSQPEASTVYLITAVPPLTAVTRPDAFTVATDVLLLLHTPPGVVFDKEVVWPINSGVLLPPEIGLTEGRALTVTICALELADKPEPAQVVTMR
ncbi:hypothetical protein D3C80_1963590 [compost metagenome]